MSGGAGNARKLTDQQIRDAVALYKDGMPMRLIADMLGCSINNIYYHVSRRTAVRRPKLPPATLKPTHTSP